MGTGTIRWGEVGMKIVKVGWNGDSVEIKLWQWNADRMKFHQIVKMTCAEVAYLIGRVCTILVGTLALSI